uniref:Uncharacterized protein n=1 Tax=Pichia angusta TaxID=870730 RepID=Q8J2J9_PICAN|nr:unknown [Ogataea angusta]
MMWSVVSLVLLDFKLVFGLSEFTFSTLDALVALVHLVSLQHAALLVHLAVLEWLDLIFHLVHAFESRWRAVCSVESVGMWVVWMGQGLDTVDNRTGLQNQTGNEEQKHSQAEFGNLFVGLISALDLVEFLDLLARQSDVGVFWQFCFRRHG